MLKQSHKYYDKGASYTHQTIVHKFSPVLQEGG